MHAASTSRFTTAVLLPCRQVADQAQVLRKEQKLQSHMHGAQLLSVCCAGRFVQQHNSGVLTEVADRDAVAATSAWCQTAVCLLYYQSCVAAH